MENASPPVDRFAVEDDDQFVIESFKKNVRLPERYEYQRPIGSGGGGMVLHAKDLSTGADVAIKKILAPFSGPEMAKRCLREIHLLRTIDHPNIITLIDSFLAGHNPDLYFVMPLMPIDMRKHLVNQNPLPVEEYMHERGVVHRDMKPENLLIDHTGKLVICDLGLARPADLHMTGYVSTRFYRAPEIMLSWKKYSEPVDVWFAGCIISEMLTGHVLFPGVDHVHHMNLILELLGSPSEAVLDKICGEKTKRYLMMLPYASGMDFRTGLYEGLLIPNEAVDLMRRLLVLDPTERMTAAEALCHPFFDGVPRPELVLCTGAGGGHCSAAAEPPRVTYDPTGFDQMGLDELQAAVEAEVGLFESGLSRSLIDTEPMMRHA